MTNDIDKVSGPGLERLFRQLQELLLELEPIWRPQPFKQRRPQWCDDYPELAGALLALEGDDYQALATSDERLQRFLSAYIPAISCMHQLTELPALAAPPPAVEPHLDWAIPGRKWQQIDRFSTAIGPMDREVLEWCGGKGHLGRVLAQRKGVQVTTLEQQAELCSQGEQLAVRAGVRQIFQQVDVLSTQSPPLSGMHAVALHACGELHRHLVRRALDEPTVAVDIAPCCYHLGGADAYRAFSPQARLSLSRDDLRLAVTGNATASARELRLRDREMAWKLGFIELRAALEGDGRYRNLPPIDKSWLKQGFQGFCRALATRESLELPPGINWGVYEDLGWRRQHEVMRLSLPRHALRRTLELWLVLDMALALQQAGYEVRLQRFCPSHVSPRNILLSARRPYDPLLGHGYAQRGQRNGPGHRDKQGGFEHGTAAGA